MCTTKNAFKFLNAQSQVNLPTQGARSVAAQVMNIMDRIWALKLLAPNIKCFAWRLIRRAIATGARAGSLSNKISKNCANCNMVENDAHLFFHCNFARAVWFSAKTPLRTSTLPLEQDGVQEILAVIINRNTSETDLQRIMTTLWYIWKARNDVRFHRKKWSVLQVHHAVEVDIEVSSSNSECAIQRGAKYAPNAQKSLPAGTQDEDNLDQEFFQQDEFRLGLPSNQTICRLPIMLSGARCYSDASTTPDIDRATQRKAGLGIFILDPVHHHKFFIKAQSTQATSVLMAEAAALALAAAVTKILNISEISFLTDSQVLVNFFNGCDLGSPPHWSIKPLTQRFLNDISNRRVQVLKIARNSNSTAHILATQAFRHANECDHSNTNCTNIRHESGCPLLMALQSVTWNFCTLVAASCC